MVPVEPPQEKPTFNGMTPLMIAAAKNSAQQLGSEVGAWEQVADHNLARDGEHKFMVESPGTPRHFQDTL